MGYSDKGWLARYLKTRLVAQESDNRYVNPELALYQLIQPTGLMYGEMTDSLSISLKGSKRDKMKILLLEMFLRNTHRYQLDASFTEEQLAEMTERTIRQIGQFYTQVYPEFASVEKKFFFGKRKPIEVAEIVLQRRVQMATEDSENFWSDFFHRSLLFLDVYIFDQWVNSKADIIVSDFFIYERQELLFGVVRLIAMASYANHSISVEERKLLDFFLIGAKLPPKMKKEAISIFENGLSLDRINLPIGESWLLRKYFLEVAILTTWVDKRKEDQEEKFLVQLASYLDFDDKELESSHLAVEGFVLQYWNELDLLQDKKSLNSVSQQYVLRLGRMVQVYKTSIIAEVSKNKMLLSLLQKKQREVLTPEEQEEARNHLLFALKQIPSLLTMPMPEKFLDWSILEEIFQKDYFAVEVPDDSI